MSRSPTAFVVLTFPRSGSTWLIEMLDSHPQIAAYDELFLGGVGVQPRAEDQPDFATYLEHTPEAARRILLPHRIAYLRAVYRDRPGIEAVGFKLIYGQARANPGLLHYFALRRVRAIHLIRANLLEAVISYEFGRMTGVFHRREGDEAPKGGISLDADGIRERLGYMEWAVARGRVWLERFRLPRIEVAYEELLGRRDETLGSVLRFLGVDPGVDSLDSSLVRVRGGSALQLVENADAVRAALTGTRFEWMLGDSRDGG
jgi:LPS sulfotransferase NodH